MPSPMPGASSTTVVSAAEATSISDWPTPTVSIRITSQPAASSTRAACGVAAASPPRWPREAIERMNTSGSVAWSCIRTRSPSRAPPENGDEGSTASTPTRLPRARYSVTSMFVEVLLPTPGEPVSPTTYAEPAYGASAASSARSCGEPSSTWEISRATARGSPPRARSSSEATAVDCFPVGTCLKVLTRDPPMAVGLGSLARGRNPDDQRVALAAAAAQGRRADAAAAPSQLEREVQHDAGSGHADRVAERDRAAVDVDLLEV